MQTAQNESVSENIVIGRNPIRELLHSGRAIDKIFVQRGEREGSVIPLVAEAKSLGIVVVEVEKQKLDSLSGGASHQGIVAFAAEKEYCEISDILNLARERGEKPFVVVADEINDPHNLGAIIRSADCLGAHGIIIPKRRSVGLTSTVSKASAGALENMLIAKAVNIPAAIDELKEAGLWIYAADMDGAPYYEHKFDAPTAIVLGSEGNGISRLVKEKCDFVISIPQYGSVNSLNVSNAAAIIMSEVARQFHKQ
ncbi:MAG: 23S rRNA (guanosine(2251)-2'-O)-methyltransferase RlmB [Clostridia bacterium]|nr:23S rRNA (guanosine(2251)-2'-O)-methyltransferase RlmB [Clostridia bacterium]